MNVGVPLIAAMYISIMGYYLSVVSSNASMSEANSEMLPFSQVGLFILVCSIVAIIYALITRYAKLKTHNKELNINKNRPRIIVTTVAAAIVVFGILDYIIYI